MTLGVIATLFLNKIKKKIAILTLRNIKSNYYWRYWLIKEEKPEPIRVTVFIAYKIGKQSKL